MTRPVTYLIRMVIFLIAVAVVAGLLSPVLVKAFDNNPLLNSFIMLVLVLGIGWNVLQVLRLAREVTWLETYQTARNRLSVVRSPRLLAPMASMLAAREGRDAQPARRNFLPAGRKPRTVPLHDRAADLPGPAGHVLGPVEDHRRGIRRHQRHEHGQQ
jgi:hypothetical protein